MWGLRRKWRYLFPCILPKQSVPSQKERVIGVNTNDRFKAHPLVELYRAKSPLEDLVAGLKLFYLNLTLKHRMESSTMTEVECCRASMASVLPGTHFIQIHKFFTAVIMTFAAVK